MENNLLPAEKQRVSEARKVTWIGFFVNLVLSVGKILAGFWGRNSAMIADGVHSLRFCYRSYCDHIYRDII